MRPEIEIRQRLKEIEEDGDGSVYEHGVKCALKFVLTDLTWIEVIT